MILLTSLAIFELAKRPFKRLLDTCNEHRFELGSFVCGDRRFPTMKVPVKLLPTIKAATPPVVVEEDVGMDKEV